jgi:hypothetical protein
MINHFYVQILFFELTTDVISQRSSVPYNSNWSLGRTLSTGVEERIISKNWRGRILASLLDDITLLQYSYISICFGAAVVCIYVSQLPSEPRYVNVVSCNTVFFFRFGKADLGNLSSKTRVSIFGNFLNIFVFPSEIWEISY